MKSKSGATSRRSPPRCASPAACTPTQTEPFATATPSGRPPSVVFVTAPVLGSMRTSVPSTSSETQTPLGVTAIPLGEAPTG